MTETRTGYDRPVERPGTGWTTFAGVLLFTVGVFNIIDGLFALNKRRIRVYDANHLLASSVKNWGWVVLIVGIIQVLAAFGVFASRTWGAVIGILVAVINAIIQLAFLPAYPAWAIVIIAVDVLVIYALSVYGGGADVMPSRRTDDVYSRRTQREM